MKNCLGKIILLTRFMREKFVESDEFCDQEREANGIILSQCIKNIKGLSSMLPLFQSEGKLNGANQSFFHLHVDSVLVQLETVIRNASKKSSPSKDTDKEPGDTKTECPLTESSTDELNDLRLQLKNAEKKRDLEQIGYKLMISKERLLVRQARKKQEVAEVKLTEEQNRVKALEKSLSESQLKLKILTDENQKLKDMQKELPKTQSKERIVRKSPSCFKSKGRSFLKAPVKCPQLSEDLWDKIYKSCSQSSSINSATRLIRVWSRDKTKTLAIGHSSVDSVTGKVASKVSSSPALPKYLGKTFGDRWLFLLRWCKERVKPYGLPMYEFSSSWTSGRALCAILHSYKPDLIDSIYLQKKEPKETLTYGVNVAQNLGVTKTIDLVGECLKKRPNFEKVVDFVDELQCCLDPDL
ncbi:hypothetical protein KR084_007484 [Drosophila pseudotakahashii]|nr:hypothetical protein KR084_007484 [Drosophila pseudotakahashii]